MKHTKGEWKLSTTSHESDGVKFNYIIGNDEFRSAVCLISIDDGDEEVKANAQLIASAPDLLEACEYVLEQAGLSKNSPCYNKLSKAISKAKGDS